MHRVSSAVNVAICGGRLLDEVGKISCFSFFVLVLLPLRAKLLLKKSSFLGGSTVVLVYTVDLT